METIESLVKAFWQDKARGLLLGQACAEAVAAPEIAHPDFAHPLSLVRQLKGDATPAAAADALGTGEHGVLDTVPVALLAFLRFPDDPVECIRFAVKVGGQTTTTAALAGAVIGARMGESGLPRHWVERIDRGDQLRENAERLTESHKFQLA